MPHRVRCRGAQRQVAWPAQVVALAVLQAELDKHVQLALRLDTPGHEHGPDVLPEADKSDGQGLAGGVDIDPPRKSDVELDHVRADIEDVAQAGVPRACIIDGDAEAPRPQSRKRLGKCLVVLDADVFGDLEDDALARRALQKVEKKWGHRCLRRDVERQVHLFWHAVPLGQSSPQGVQLQLDAEAHGRRLCEPLVRWARWAGGETRECLEADHCSAHEIDDRLVHDPYAVLSLKDSFNSLTARSLFTGQADFLTAGVGD